MKKFLFALVAIISLSLTGCKNVPNNTPTATFTEKDTTWSPVTDSTGKIISTELKQKTFVTAAPSWGQSFHYAFKSGYTLWLILGLLAIAVSLTVFILNQKDLIPFKSEPNPFVLNGALFAILVLGAISIDQQPSNIRYNNYKKWDKGYYDNVIKTEGSSQRLWDSLEVSSRIVGAYHK